MKKPTVAFICVHNSCRSQIAEALGKLLAHDTFHSYSAGTEKKDQINQDAVALMKELYDLDMEATQQSKLIDGLPEIDIVITMGCNVNCPYLPAQHSACVLLPAPRGKPRSSFFPALKTIDATLFALPERILKGEIVR